MKRSRTAPVVLLIAFVLVVDVVLIAIIVIAIRVKEQTW